MNRHKILLFALLAFAAVTRMWNLNYPKGYFFDEVYNAFTTQEMAKGNKDAYEWSHTSPVEGTAYGWTHPPLAKLIATTGILAFGDNEFGWRIANALVGIGIVYLVYQLGVKLLKSQDYALIAGTLVALDGLVLVQSRINMNDIVATFFVLVAFTTFVRFQLKQTSTNLMLLGVSLGLLIATKWTGLYGLLVLGAWVGLQNLTKIKNWPRIFVSLLVVPALIYFLSYSQYFILGGSLANFWELQKQMWWYNTTLDATHTYQSLWWTWPIDLRPVWYFVDYSIPNKIANIYALGNPFLFWLGLVGMLFTLQQAIKHRSWRVWLIVVGYLTFWLPWARAPRIMFLYHYLPSVPFLCLGLAYMLSQVKSKYLTLTTLVLVGAAFVFFYPVWTAIHVPQAFANHYFWLTSWR